MTEKFIDKDLGVVYVLRNSRARRLIARRKEDSIQLTVPSTYSLAQIESVLAEIKPRLLALKPVSGFLLDENTKIKTVTFYLNIKKENVQNFYISLTDNVLNIVCPSTVVFSDNAVQQKLRRYIENTLRNEAKRIIPEKISFYAKQNNFTFSDVKINKSRSRWGSCSSKKNINISLYCMFLPEYLLDFVILHELCHTMEMNHGEKFWDLLDKITSNKAKQLTKELKNFKIAW